MQVLESADRLARTARPRAQFLRAKRGAWLVKQGQGSQSADVVHHRAIEPPDLLLRVEARYWMCSDFRRRRGEACRVHEQVPTPMNCTMNSRTHSSPRTSIERESSVINNLVS
jgi:hypothetical protein